MRLVLVLLCLGVAGCATKPEVQRLPDGRVEIRGERALLVQTILAVSDECADAPVGPERHVCRYLSMKQRIADLVKSPPPGCWSINGGRDIRCDRDTYVLVARPEDLTAKVEGRQ